MSYVVKWKILKREIKEINDRINRIESLNRILIEFLLVDLKLIDKAVLFKQAGLKVKDIAVLLGKTPNNIGVMLNYVKNKGADKNGEKRSKLGRKAQRL